MTTEVLISRLDAKQTRRGSWLARCPAHKDKSPSLAIRETDDGRTLLHCFAGCPAEDVLAAVGLEFADLVPDKPIGHARPERRPFPAVDVLRAIAFEALVVVQYATSMASGKMPTPDDRERLVTAAGRIDSAIMEAGL